MVFDPLSLISYVETAAGLIDFFDFTGGSQESRPSIRYDVTLVLRIISTSTVGETPST